MNKACLVLILAMCPATLFAGVTMVTRTTQTTTKGCNFRVDNCATSVANDPDYFRYKDGTLIGNGTSNGSPGGPVAYQETFLFKNYAPMPPTVDDLVEQIRKDLSNCPEVTVSYNDDSGDITVHYLTSTCNDCDWVVNVRNVNEDDFVWTRTSDNYSPYLGQMERQKFHTTNKDKARDIQSACVQICKINNWATFK